MSKISLKRIYEPANDSDGYRVLVDRLWPRGLSKVAAKVDEWDKDLAPSTELRKWFNHIPERFEEFKQRYLLELQAQQPALQRLKSLSENQDLCLLFGAKDEEHNQAVVLKQALMQIP
jgi:uncharacterized protein YeaO (DUF488 family)